MMALRLCVLLLSVLLLLLRLLVLRVLLLLRLLVRGLSRLCRLLRSRWGNAWSTKQMTSCTMLERLRSHRVLKRLQVVEHVFGFLVTLLRPTFATAHDDRGKPLGNAITTACIERLCVCHQFGASQLGVLGVAKNVSTRNRAIKHRAHGIKVRGRGDITRVQDLLGRHVLKRSERHVRTREVCLFQILARARFDAAHAEIDDDSAHLPVGLRLHDDIAGLHVAMNDVRAVQIA